MEIMNIEQASDFLHITKSTLHQWCHARKVPYFRAGKKALFNREDLETWLKSKRVKTLDELNKEAESVLRGDK